MALFLPWLWRYTDWRREMKIVNAALYRVCWQGRLWTAEPIPPLCRWYPQFLLTFPFYFLQILDYLARSLALPVGWNSCRLLGIFISKNRSILQCHLYVLFFYCCITTLILMLWRTMRQINSVSRTLISLFTKGAGWLWRDYLWNEKYMAMSQE